MTHNLRDPAFVEDPYPTYDQWRQRAPVVQRSIVKDWLVTGFDEIVPIFTDGRFGHRHGYQPNVVEAHDAALKTPIQTLIARGGQTLARWPLTNDPPAHGRLRKPFMDLAAFGQGTQTVDWVKQVTGDALVRARANGGLDVVSDLAAPLTTGYSCEQLGIPADDRPAIQGLVRRVEDAIDVDTPAELVASGLLAVASLDDYIRRLLRARHPTLPPAATTLARLIRAVEHHELDEEEASALGALSLLAGSSTTESLIASAIKNVLSKSNVWTALAGNSDLLDGAVEETLRFDTPAQVVSRTALSDVWLGTEKIAAGETVRLLLGAGNRDPRRFEEPARFDVTRPRRRILSMGLGIHTCPGAGQARLVAKRVLHHMSESAPNARLAVSTFKWRAGFQVRGLESLRVEF